MANVQFNFNSSNFFTVRYSIVLHYMRSMAHLVQYFDVALVRSSCPFFRNPGHCNTTRTVLLCCCTSAVQYSYSLLKVLNENFLLATSTERLFPIRFLPERIRRVNTLISSLLQVQVTGRNLLYSFYYSKKIFLLAQNTFKFLTSLLTKVFCSL